ncbi:MAG: exodeoxyribonuclease VII large subunit [Anaerolineales bacterium]|jgi:exodeoxyribonuclease VII large subunit|nr:exodeoxyribonuclease VII large subunit [Anaerolineales bacterium]
MMQLPLFDPTVWSVSQLTRHVRELMERDKTLQDVWVQGEVSNLSRPSSGHLYFTLKDSSSALKCVMWRSAVLRQAEIPREGQAVEVHGSISVYETAGAYQLYADLIQPTGLGKLYQEFIRLKNRLEAEGLFAVERKRPIPAWPKIIGIVTSPTGAAVRDILNTLRRRYPLTRVVLAPTQVQGEEAPTGIRRALELLNQQIRPDVIIVARGGGSIEDLWAFNDEGVVRAIADSQAAVISGIGHETDFTIADFASDLRAATPTAAAELATPDRSELGKNLEAFSSRIVYAVDGKVEAYHRQLSRLANHFKLLSPQTRIRSSRQRVDDLSRQSIRQTQHLLQINRTRLDSATQRLAALNPTAILERGYAIVRSPTGKIIHSIQQVNPGESLEVLISDGQFDAQVQQITATRQG